MIPWLQRRIAEIVSLRAVFVAPALLLGLLTPTFAATQRTFEPQLVYLLPVYCRYTQVFRSRLPGGNNAAEIERWTKRMGSIFVHMHHYCFGLMDANRAAFLSKTPQDRKHHLGNSILEFDYVIQRAPRDFSLLPEIITKKGESMVRLGRGAEAVLEFQQAIRIKPGYAQAYAGISDYYRESGDLRKAREWLVKGLAAAPGNPALRQRMATLDRPTSKVQGKK